MRTSTQIHKVERVHSLPAETGNWMQLTIAPLVAEKLEYDEPLPGEASESDGLGTVVGATGPTCLADDDSA